VSVVVDYGTDVEAAVERLIEAIHAAPVVAERYPHRWLALALLDEDPGVAERLEAVEGGRAVVARRDRLLEELKGPLGASADTAIAAARFQAVNEIAGDAAKVSRPSGRTRTDRIDAVVANRWLGIPIFLASMWLVFTLTTDVAGSALEWLDSMISGPVAGLVSEGATLVGLGGTWAESLLTDGAVAGVGAVVVFVPILLSLYLALALLEDTGYMARAAFVMDRLMRGVGLQGKSFLPMLVGFGCTVPAVYATRTLEKERDRILTGLLVPFMSCGARLPVYVLMASAFFPGRAGLVVFGMYLLGIVVALVVGWVLKRSLLPAADPSPAIMEMPPYRLPTARTIWSHTWRRTKAFLKDAGSIIFATTIVVWLLMAVPVGSGGSFGAVEVEESAFGAVAGAAAPVFEPAGFGGWEAAGSLLSGFVAKEVVISTMAQSYGAEGDGEPADGEEQAGLMSAIRDDFEETSGGAGALAAVAFMVFVLLYTPCMAAVGAIRSELGGRWMWFSIVGQTALAWAAAVAVFQVGRLLS